MRSSFLSQALCLALFWLIIFDSSMSGQGAYPFCEGALYGLVSADGEVILSPKYDRIELPPEPAKALCLVVTHARLQGLVSNTGEELISPTIDQLHCDEKSGLAWYYDDSYHMLGLHVYSVKNRKIVYTSDSLRLIEVIGEGTPFAILDNGKTGRESVISANGKVIIPHLQGSASIAFPEQPCPLICVRSMARSVYIDCNGDPTTFEAYMKQYNISDAPQFIDMLVDDEPVRRGSIPIKYTLPDDLKLVQDVTRDGSLISLIVRDTQNKYGLLSPQGDTLLPFEHIQLITEANYICSITNGYRGLYSFRGREILKPVFAHMVHSPIEFHGHILVFTESGYCGFADKHGNVFLPDGALKE